MRKGSRFYLLAFRAIILIIILAASTYKLEPVYAQTTCTYAQNCDAGSGPSSGQQECTGIKNLETDNCGWDETGEIEPNCGRCEAIAAPENTPTPTLTPTITPSPTPVKLSQDEQAMNNLNQGLLPKEAIRTTPSTSQSLWDSIIGSFKSMFKFPLEFLAKSESVHQAYLPEEIRPEYKEKETQIKQKPGEVQIQGITTSGPLETLTSLLGGSTGFYGVTLPKEVQGLDIQGSEGAFEKAYFPEGIRPITGQ